MIPGRCLLMVFDMIKKNDKKLQTPLIRNDVCWNVEDLCHDSPSYTSRCIEAVVKSHVYLMRA